MQSRIIDEKYQIVRELGRGGMGAVYEALQLVTGRKVALKLILDAPGLDQTSNALRRFEREARAGGSVDSRHVVPVIDTGIDAATNNLYLVMDLLSGEDLRQLIRRVGTLSPELVLRVAAQACLGLSRVHEQGIVHRDIKSGNIYLARRDGGEIEVKVLDFGIAKLRVDPLAVSENHDLTRSGAVLGSPLYMSPEQATGSRDLDGRSDIWSLGVVMYEALSGAPPHSNQALGALILAICSEPVRSIRERAPWVAPEVAAIVHKALALDPSQRFRSAEEMRAAILPLIPGEAGIHESMLQTASASSPVEPESSTSPLPKGHTTADAFTLSRATAKKPMRTRRWAAFVASGLAISAGAGFWRYRAVESSTAERAVESAAALVAARPTPRQASPATSVVPSDPATLHASAAGPTPSATQAAHRPVSTGLRPAASSPRGPSSTSPGASESALPAAAPAPPAGSELTIDRRFD